MSDRDAITETVLNYVEGWYSADSTRMDKALHPKLAKRRVTPEGEVWDSSRDWMVEFTGKGQGRIENPESGLKRITILDMADAIASVKLVSEQFDDYLHLAKCGETWVIVNALWDYRASDAPAAIK